MGDADVAHLAFGFQLARQRQLGLPVAQVVHGQQLDLVGAQAPQRIGELRFAGGAVVGGELGRQEDLVAHTQLGHQVAQHVLGIAVVGRGVDDAGAAGDKPPQHLLQRLAPGGVHLETARGAHADHRDRLARGRNGAPCDPGRRVVGGGEAGQGMQGRGGSRERGGGQEGAAAGHGGTSGLDGPGRWCVSLGEISVVQPLPFVGAWPAAVK